MSSGALVSLVADGSRALDGLLSALSLTAVVLVCALAVYLVARAD